MLKSLGITIVQPMSADQLARTKRTVAAEIIRAGGTAVFEDVSDENGGKVRHTPSGLVCPMGKKDQRILIAGPDAATCVTSHNGDYFRTSFDRAPAGATLDWAARYA